MKAFIYDYQSSKEINVKDDLILDLAKDVLDDMKAIDVDAIDVRELTSITDHMIFCTGTSNRHARSIVDRVVEKMKEISMPVLGIEGYDSGQWVLIDLGDAILHVMLKDVREFYKLEDLWSVGTDFSINEN